MLDTYGIDFETYGVEFEICGIISRPTGLISRFRPVWPPILSVVLVLFDVDIIQIDICT